MPIPPEIKAILDFSSEIELKKDYIKKLPTLDPQEFPDELTIKNILQGNHYFVLQRILREAGLKDGERRGVNHMLRIAGYIDDYELTLGIIRELALEDLQKAREHLNEGRAYSQIPSVRALVVLKKLCGSKENF